MIRNHVSSHIPGGIFSKNHSGRRPHIKRAYTFPQPVRYPFTALVKQVGRLSENEMGDGIGGETLIGRLGQASD
ncbi:hypothetical protein EAI28_23590 [Faecalicatena contorta]|uniref:hypothetical protein n=1 Tax=Faecalicatena contorta TaxID=39482 RepID=UPI003011CACD|nr:hypothetical protein [Faecalicatena contorta]